MKKLVTRRWGYYKVLDSGPDYVVKELVIYPNCGISYQRHFEREEFWTIRSGVATIRYENTYTTVERKESFHVHKRAWHQVYNTEKSNLVILEFQVGNCSEEDIERLEYYE
jgi:mannose-6-phosphate isomerase-like protein (cupin superfamily)